MARTSPKWQAESVNAYLYDCTDDFCETVGQLEDAPYLREMIDYPEKRDKRLWPEFVEFCANEIEADLLSN